MPIPGMGYGCPMTKQRLELLHELRRHLASKAGIIPAPRELADPIATYSALVEAIGIIERAAENADCSCMGWSSHCRVHGSY